MNILRYRWPVVVAAGLHGALFVSFPTTRIVEAEKTIAEPLPRFPEDTIEMHDLEPATAEAQPTGGSPALPDIPELPPPPMVDRSKITIPIEENTAPRNIDTTRILLPDRIAGVGPGIGENGIHGSISRPTDLDRIPRATAQMPPDYPSSMRLSNEAGSVTVEFDVDTSGRVVRASAVRFTHREFVDAAVRAVLKWHFEPGKRNGRVVPFRMAVPIEFGLATN